MDQRRLTRISACRVCGRPDPETFFDLGYQPFANHLLDSPDEAEKSYPLQLSWCPGCRLVQLNHTADPGELFSNYYWVTGTSPTTRAYAKRFCEEAMGRIEENISNSYVLEAASNDGTFLKPFVAQGVTVQGVDPAVNIAALANADDIPTEVGFFGEELARQLVARQGPAALVFARNVLPHVADVNDFVAGLGRVMSPDGLLILEIHYARHILDGLHYDSIYHEHLCYFSIESVAALLRRHGLSIIDIGESPISGGSLVLYIKAGGMASPSSEVARRLKEEHADKTNELAVWRDFASRSRDHANQIARAIADENAAGRCVAAYGASARSSTMINFAAIGSSLIMIADQNTIKHGKYTAGSHCRICGPEVMIRSNPDTILVSAWNFFDEIEEFLRGPLGFTGRIIKPFPELTIMEIE